ncbi:MAG TPA: ATP-binding protein, partial [Gammaproteobacteria bacterium]|nr:ATP-binding protein [Gammaproteobacteria bacterium]
GARLTIWYAAMFAVGLTALGITMWLALRLNLYHAIDDSLRDRVVGIARFLADHATRLDEDEVKEEFRAHGELFQVADASGDWVHRGADVADLDLGPGSAVAADGTFQDAVLHGAPVRVFTRAVDVGSRHFTVQIAAPLAQLEEGLYGSLWFLLPTFPLVLVLASAGGYWLSRRALAPVDDITRAAQSITADNLSQRLAVAPAGDELSRLSETLNAMIGRLEASFRTISRFTADASHELRTPLAVMRTTAEVALRGDSAPGDHAAALEHVVVEIDRMSHLVENLLMIAKADSGEAELQRRPVDVVAAVAEACEQACVLARVKGVEVSVRLPERSVSILGDAHALRRLFLILLDNAVKYTPSGGRCEVFVSAHAAEVVGTVTDTGIGISTEDLPHIFDRFYRVDRARSREQGGAGLGLAIGRWIAEAHGGAIAVDSELDRGSSFRVHLPLA